ncbi:MAG: aldo/keto reductase [SAR202 cluster bacterium Io17-Chloro-G7]|nr:MAG: aldo/keto reductase [SAR202 cluster bacterium Io17-Chloro-G7]
MESNHAPSLPPSSRFEFSPNFQTCRILNGMWQVSGAHGHIDADKAVESMFDYLDLGFTTWDLADHYGPAEDFIGEFRRRLVESRGLGALADIQAFTKWVPRVGPMNRKVVEGNIDISMRRINVECLDLLQFHWWNYEDERYLEAVGHLEDLRNEGKIRHVGLTNFDTQILQNIVDQGFEIVSNQVQYSLIDRRPQVRMAEYCERQGIHLLAYGALAGGLLTDRFLGQHEPSRAALDTASLAKYIRMIEAWGGWNLFQELLVTLRSIADRHQVSIADVAVRYVLECPAVAGVIVGVRLGVADHREDNARVFSFSMDQQDLDQIDSVLSQSRDLYQIIGDCGDEYRR